MKKQLSALIPILAVLAPSQAALADRLGNEFLTRNESRLIRLDALAQRRGRMAEEAPAAASNITVGVAYDYGEDGTLTWNTPFTLESSLPGTGNKLSLGGNGYTRSTHAGTALSGLDDFSFAVLHSISYRNTDKLVIGGGLNLPTGGDIGSSSGAEFLKAGWTHTLTDLWKTTLVAKGLHEQGTASSGASHFVYASAIELTRSLGDDDMALSLDTARQSGVTGPTHIGLAYDHNLSKADLLSFSLSRGLTSGARDTSAEVDFSRDF